ncbi:MAG TPA: hypothetical protein ENG77_05085, partial [Chromatiales bacterium]|nr:hypothetical protein [Chromatiales bacterium]
YPLIATTRHRLARLYASERAPDAKRAGKARILRELRERYRVLKTSWGGYAGYDHWFDGGMNNAKLAALQTYREYVPAFRRLLARAHGNFAAFYATARARARLPKAQRDTVLGALSTCTKRPAGDACNCDGVSDSNDVGRASPALQAAQRGFVRRAGLGPPATFVTEVAPAAPLIEDVHRAIASMTGDRTAPSTHHLPRSRILIRGDWDPHSQPRGGRHGAYEIGQPTGRRHAPGVRDLGGAAPGTGTRRRRRGGPTVGRDRRGRALRTPAGRGPGTRGTARGTRARHDPGDGQADPRGARGDRQVRVGLQLLRR